MTQPCASPISSVWSLTLLELSSPTDTAVPEKYFEIDRTGICQMWPYGALALVSTLPAQHHMPNTWLTNEGPQIRDIFFWFKALSCQH